MNEKLDDARLAKIMKCEHGQMALSPLTKCCLESNELYGGKYRVRCCRFHRGNCYCMSHSVIDDSVEIMQS